jgi:hypothetical protein
MVSSSRCGSCARNLGGDLGFRVVVVRVGFYGMVSKVDIYKMTRRTLRRAGSESELGWCLCLVEVQLVLVQRSRRALDFHRQSDQGTHLVPCA